MLTLTHPMENRNSGIHSSRWTNLANIRYTPTDVGTYTFQFTVPEQWINGSRPDLGINYAYQYLASTSPNVTLTVQQQPVSAIPGAPLPTTYWQRPIQTPNQEWSAIAGDWLTATYNATGRFNPYTTAPNSAHILWTKPVDFGGIMGGEFSYNSYYSGYSYFPKSANKMIMYGRLYYDTVTGGGNTLTTTHCVDLRTGKEIWQPELHYNKWSDTLDWYDATVRRS